MIPPFLFGCFFEYQRVFAVGCVKPDIQNIKFTVFIVYLLLPNPIIGFLGYESKQVVDWGK